MNIIRLLEDHLPAAIEELDVKITEAYNLISIHEARRAQLLRIASAAGVEVRSNGAGSGSMGESNPGTTGSNLAAT